MSDQRPRGRGRGRGRASVVDAGGSGPQQQRGPPQQQRGPPQQQRGPPQQQRGPPQQQRGPPQQQRGPPPPQGAWSGGRPPQGAWSGGGPPQGAWSGGGPPQGPPSQGAWGGSRPQQPQGPPGASWGPRPGGAGPRPGDPRPTAPVGAGRASQRQPVEKLAEQMGQLGAGDASSAGAVAGTGRGATRGRRNVAVDVLRTRPQHATTKCGITGQAVRLQSNYFELLSTPNWCLYNYRVDFNPEEDKTEFRRKMMRPHENTLGGGGYIFDGTNLYVSHRLPKDPTELFSQHPIRDEPVRLTLKMVGDLANGDFHYIQLFNNIIRRCLRHLKLQLIGRNYFDAGARVDIRDYQMELWPGYVTSIRQHENKILMCAEVTHKVMRRDSVLDLLKECHTMKDGQRIFEQRIVGCIVLTDYNNRTYRVDDVDWDTSPDNTFKLRTNESTTYRDYFQAKYGKKITDLRQPMLISRAKPREIRVGMAEIIYLVPELCRMTGLTDAQRSNFQLMRALAEHTRVAPDNRIRKLITFSQRLRQQPAVEKEFKQWDLKLSEQLVNVAGRILPPETITVGGEIRFSAGKDADWTRELRSNPMLIIANVPQWSVICPTQFRVKAQEFVQMLIRAARGMRFNLPNPQVQEIPDDRVPNYLEALEMVINRHRPTCILCIVSNNKLDRYSAIKKKCCVDRAVPTQVFLAKTLNNKGLMSVATKVAIQINCKLGGAPWGTAIPLNDLMVIGFDVCHDTMNKSKSFGGMVASLNSSCTQYFSTCSPHASGEELSNDFALNVEKAVVKYKEVNGGPPKHIIIYRDGVGDGQISYVHAIEVDLIKQALQKYYSADSLRLAFIIVSKRINTRFFFNSQNPPPGTVVDDVVTLPERYDFFIVSQNVRQGTVSPTSYNVIEDSSGLDPDKLQRLTYKLCHLYFNWSGTVRVPAPCQLAHKLAFLVSQAVHRQPHPHLSQCLYFL